MSGIIWLASYPKSGNTWLRIFITNYMRNSDQPANINELDTWLIANDREYIEDVLGIQSTDMNQDEIEYYRPLFWKEIAVGKDPIFIKVHDAYTRNAEGEPLFPKDIAASAIYIVRNPLDVAVSYAHHVDKSVDEVIGLMASDRHGLCQATDKLYPMLPTRLLSWSHHIASWVDEAGLSLLIVRYEDMYADPGSTFTGILRFIGLNVDTSRLRKAIAFSDFDILRAQEANSGFIEKQPTAVSFFRKGTIGAWQKELSKNQIQCIINSHRQMMERFGYLAEAEDF